MPSWPCCRDSDEVYASANLNVAGGVGLNGFTTLSFTPFNVLIDPTVTPGPESNVDEVIWDVVQTGIGFAGMIPIVGIAFDVGNAALYAARGKMDEAAMSLVSAIPIGGDLAGAANLARKTAKLVARHTAQNAVAQGVGVAVSRATGGDREFSFGQVAAAGITGGLGAKLSAAGGRAVNASRSVVTRTAALSAGYAGFSFVGSAAQQFIDNGTVDWGQAAQEAAIAGISAALGQAAFDKTCFAADTPMIARNEQGWKRADEVQIDDYLASRDEHDPEAPVVWNRVEEVFVAQGEIWELEWQDRTIRTTAEHPFYVYKLGWTPARELQPGQLLATMDGRYLPLITLASTVKTETVYNFRIAEGHTYFVGTPEWNSALWAHNRCNAWKGYEDGIAGLYGGKQAFKSRTFYTDTGNIRVADRRTVVGGLDTSIEAKHVSNWSKSIHNPNSVVGSKRFAQNAQAKLVGQARDYLDNFDQVIYHSNSVDFIAHYTARFQSEGLDMSRIKFIHTPS